MQRVTRIGWWLRRLNRRRLLVLAALVATAIGVGWLYGGLDSAAFSGLLAVGVGVVLGRPVTSIFTRAFVRSVPWRAPDTDLHFAGTALGFTAVGFATTESPVARVHRILGSGGGFAHGDFAVQLWVVASADDGVDWTVAQGRPGEQPEWTSTIDGRLTIADFDESGRPDPFRAAHRLVNDGLGVPVVDIDFVCWGTELNGVSGRPVVVGIVRTSMDAAGLRRFEYPAGDGQLRHAMPVAVTSEGVEDALASSHALEWRGGAAVGLIELLDQIHPGAWAALEHRLAERWSAKAMFARVARGTAQVTGRAMTARF